MEIAPRPRLIIVITSAIVALIGIALVLGGAWLAVLGGSLYYLITGLAMIAAAWLLLSHQAAAFWLYALILVGTMIWALWEVGFNFWPLAPRGNILVPLGIWLLLLWIFGPARPLRAGAGYALAGSLVLAAIVVVIALSTSHEHRGSLSLQVRVGRRLPILPLSLTQIGAAGAEPISAIVTRRSRRSRPETWDSSRWPGRSALAT